MIILKFRRPFEATYEKREDNNLCTIKNNLNKWNTQKFAVNCPHFITIFFVIDHRIASRLSLQYVEKMNFYTLVNTLINLLL